MTLSAADIATKIGGAESHSRQLMNQADYFYVSGHGHHNDASLNCGSGYSIFPSEIGNCWRDDLDCAVFLACSVLDIGDFLAQHLPKRQVIQWGEAGGAWSPGKQWYSLGPIYFLGYGWTAPRDTQGGNQIAAAFASQINAGTTPVEAWRIANDRNEGRNACAIDLSSAPVKFWYWKKDFWGNYSWECKTEGIDW